MSNRGHFKSYSEFGAFKEAKDTLEQKFGGQKKTDRYVRTLKRLTILSQFVWETQRI